MAIPAITLAFTVFYVWMVVKVRGTKPQRTGPMYSNLPNDIGDLFYEDDRVFYIIACFFCVVIGGFLGFFWLMTLLDLGVITEISRSGLMGLLK